MDHKKISRDKKQWQKDRYEKSKEKMPLRDYDFTTVSGSPVAPLYTPDDMADLDYEKDIGFPGVYPFTRGVQATGYRARLWTMRQFSGFGTAQESNERLKYLLEKGQTGLSIAFDLPTLMGRDSDDPLSQGEVGKCGVAISSLADMEVLFSGIPLDRISTSMTINAPAAILLAMYIVTAEKQGVESRKIRGTIQNDILKEYIAQKEWVYPPKPSIRMIIDTFEYCLKEAPLFNTISISGYHIREAGSTALQELAFTLRDGVEYVEEAVKRGLKVDEFAPRLSFFFNAHNDLFEEIAKYRAARKIWARVMKERFHAKHERSLWLRFHTQTAGCSLMAQQPMNNIIRVTIQALAAALGGTQSLHTNSMDETLALPSEKAVEIALRTQQVLAYESGIANTMDPLAGSYFVEHMTRSMEEGCFDYFDKIDRLGGMVAAIEKAFPQREIQDAAFAYQLAVEKNRKIIVGLNKYQVDEQTPIDILQIDEEAVARQVEALEKLRKERDNDKCRASLDDLLKAAEEEKNLMPCFIECVRHYCTVGEIINALKELYGEYHEPPMF
jgi:methylmalonyl-CoA mutase N-terminal domain/subunit